MYDVLKSKLKMSLKTTKTVRVQGDLRAEIFIPHFTNGKIKHIQMIKIKTIFHINKTMSTNKTTFF